MQPNEHERELEALFALRNQNNDTVPTGDEGSTGGTTGGPSSGNGGIPTGVWVANVQTGFMKGYAQGVLNLTNRLVNSAIQTSNSANPAVHLIDGISWMTGLPAAPRIPTIEYSRGRIVDEGGTPGGWDDMHGWSSFLTGEGTMFLVGGVGGAAFKGASLVDDAAKTGGMLANAPVSALEKLKPGSGPTSGTFSRFKSPQKWINSIIDQNLSNLKLRAHPKYNGMLKDYGRATLFLKGPGRTTIGKPSLINKNELIDTIVHEELHHRLWQRFLRGSKRAESIIDDIDYEELYVNDLVNRYMRMRGFRK